MFKSSQNLLLIILEDLKLISTKNQDNVQKKESDQYSQTRRRSSLPLGGQSCKAMEQGDADRSPRKSCLFFVRGGFA